MIKLKNNVFLPQTILGKTLPYDLTKKAKKIRIKSYLIESLVFAILVSILNTIALIFNKLFDTIVIFKSNTLNIIFTYFITFLLSYLISYVFNYILSERKIKKYNNLLK